MIFELEQLIIREITSCDTKKATDVFKSLLISNTDMDMFWFDQFISWIRENFLRKLEKRIDVNEYSWYDYIR